MGNSQIKEGERDDTRKFANYQFVGKRYNNLYPLF